MSSDSGISGDRLEATSDETKSGYTDLFELTIHLTLEIRHFLLKKTVTACRQDDDMPSQLGANL